MNKLICLTISVILIILGFYIINNLIGNKSIYYQQKFDGSLRLFESPIYDGSEDPIGYANPREQQMISDNSILNSRFFEYDESRMWNDRSLDLGKKFNRASIKENNKIMQMDNFLEKVCHRYHTINMNIKKLKNKNVDESDFKNIVQNFINPYTQNKLNQTNNSYYYICKPAENGSNMKYLYSWKYPKWEGLNIKDINDPLLNSIKKNKSLNMSFDNSMSIGAYKWDNGLRLSINRTFTNNGKKYIIGSGINLDDFDFNGTENEKNFINYIRNYKKYLQNIVYRIKHIHPSNIENFDNANKFLSSISYLYTLKKINVYVPDYDNFSNTIVYNIDYNTLKNITEPKKIENSKISFIENIYDTYSTGNNNAELFNDGDYGLVTYNVNEDYWLSIFYVIYNNNTQEIISLEMKISNYY